MVKEWKQYHFTNTCFYFPERKIIRYCTQSAPSMPIWRSRKVRILKDLWNKCLKCDFSRRLWKAELIYQWVYILNKSIKICSPKQGGNYSKFNPKYTEDFLYHLFYFQFHLYCQKKPGLVVAAENWKKRKYAREKYYTLDQTIMWCNVVWSLPLKPTVPNRAKKI